MNPKHAMMAEARSARGAKPQAGFTLAEVLAAMLFMAIVIPVAVHGLRIASRAGVVAERKAVAAQLADRVLTEQVVGSTSAGRSGVLEDGPETYRWEVVEDPWTEGDLRLLTVRVIFPVQEQDYEVLMSTLLDTSSSGASATNSMGSP